MEEKLFTEQRRDEIVRLIQEKKSIGVQELSSLFRVSGTTIRQDLTALEKQGLLRRTHGGAVMPNDLRQYIREPEISERTHQKEKIRIAEEALRFVNDSETILLDNGTTMAAFAAALSQSLHSGLTICSNDLNGMQILEAKENCDLRILGGAVRKGFHYTYGPQVLEELRHYHFRRLFLSTSAVSADGLSTANSDLAAVKHAMIDASEEVILLTDSSKFGKIDFRKFADISSVHTVITDTGITEEHCRYIREAGVRLITV
ncbi:MAG: DeoR/GlpR family DNA-binding transcription regulator [Solobacterium sp.]|nr:DeoR/GlpR family DNA-binding transcription regulator [Solobacterium sp.]